MKANFCTFLVLFFMLLHFSVFAQSTNNNESKQSKNPSTSTKTEDPKTSAKNNPDNTKTDDSQVKKSANPISDSLQDLTKRVEDLEQKIRTVSSPAENPWFDGIGNTSVIMLIGAISLLALIASVVAYFSNSSKYSMLSHNVKGLQKSNESSTLSNINDPYKRQMSEMNDIITQLKLELKESKDKIVLQSDKLNDLIIEVNAKNSMNSSVEENTISQMKEVDRIIENQTFEDKGQFFNVEYFVESGIVKFRQTDTSTPFYIQKFKDKSLLTINETVYASTYSESIEKCFMIRGRMTGQYRNITPGNCTFDDFTKTWKLETTGEIESI